MSQDRGHFKSRKGYGNYKNKNKVNVGDIGRQVAESLNENSLVIQQFRKYAAELDAKHDKYEKIVKVSRDITIESKRIIFLLHTLDKESKRDTILSEAEKRLSSLIEVMFKKVALELEGEDPYMYLRAYRAGFQEFIEALTFFWYLKDKSLHGWVKVEDSMKYTIKDLIPNSTDDKKDNQECDIDANIQESDNKSGIQESINDTSIERQVQVLVSPVEYILGIADLTGELMRKCINNLATGDIDNCFETCNFVRKMYTGFLGCSGAGREVSRKLYTLKQSLTKMENVCYTIKVRGSEVPKHMLADVAVMSCTGDTSLDDDEGYQVN
ncbi:translin-associated protein X [Phymastichus coffea]|uniref:translin-associated protein X n=1 Tax=Phymastichus coffea TaxID=108790 RepID=UPI00273BA303|nr:translin-associated protein X [Phymastichus coffea]